MIRSLRSYFTVSDHNRQSGGGRDDPPQFHISGHANVHLGDRFGVPTNGTSYTRTEAKARARERSLVARNRFETAITLLLFTLHCESILSIPASYGEYHNEPVREASAQIDNLSASFRRRLLAGTRKSSSVGEFLCENLLFEVARSCVDRIERFEAAVPIHDVAVHDTCIDTSGYLLDLKGLQKKIVAAVFLLLCLDGENEEYEEVPSDQDANSATAWVETPDFHTYYGEGRSNALVPESTSARNVRRLRLSSATERIVADRIQSLQLDHPDVFQDMTTWTKASYGEEHIQDASKVKVDQWFLKHERKFVDCANNIVSELAKQHEAQVRSQILVSLGYTEMDRRYHAVTQAQAKTFHWIFKDQITQDDSAMSFARWLAAPDSCPDHLFWVRGKPGSGKSTLMRYLHDHSKTRDIAATWSVSKALLVIKCFFWSSGSPIQRSQRGLLQSLLFQMLRERSDFPRSLCPTQWDLTAHRLIANHVSAALPAVPEMSLVDIQKSVADFAIHYKANTNLLLLIDGLDEFQGKDEDRSDICRMLKALAEAENVKVCASSRPWNVYLDFFEDSPQLRLELLTRADIKTYVTHGLCGNAQFDRWQKIEPRGARQVIDDVVRKAEGVFLWVVLVVRSLLEGVKNGDDVRELANRLKIIPSNLSDLFEQMLSRLSPAYLESASQIFDVALNKNHLVLLYFFMHVGEDADQLLDSIRVRGWGRVLELQEHEERRINARCMGLLEFCPSPDGIGGWKTELHTVEFLHRTARDYMADQRERLASWQTTPWDLKAAIRKGTLLAILSYNPKQPWLTEGTLLTYCKETFAELDHISSSAECTEMILAHDQHLEMTIHFLTTIRGHVGDFSDLLTFAIVEGADQYALRKIQRIDRLNNHPIQAPLLLYTVHPNYRKSRAPSIVLTKALLERGASPNDTWRGTSVWCEVIMFLPSVRPENHATYAEALKVLMEAGASDWSKYHKNWERLLHSNLALTTQLPTNLSYELLEVGKRAHVWENPHSFSNKLKARFRRSDSGHSRENSIRTTRG